MTREEQLKIYEEVNSKLTKLSKSKGEDYAGEDVLSNFKNLADACKALQIDITTPVGVSLFFQVHKISRISNLLQSGKIPNNEGIDDSFLDDINYAIFGYLNWLDQNKGKSFEALNNLKGINKEPETVNGVLNDLVYGKITPYKWNDYSADGYVGLQNVDTPKYDKTNIPIQQQKDIDPDVNNMVNENFN